MCFDFRMASYLWRRRRDVGVQAESNMAYFVVLCYSSYDDSEYIYGLLQERRNSGALATKLHLFCINPPIWHGGCTTAPPCFTVPIFLRRFLVPVFPHFTGHVINSSTLGLKLNRVSLYASLSLNALNYWNRRQGNHFDYFGTIR